jgi:molybdate transport system permease protein
MGTFTLELEHHARSPRLALLGPSGSGKTAALRAIAGLLGPDVGEVSYGGRRVDAVPVEDRRVGYVPQGYPLFPHLTVWQQVMFGVGADPGLGAHWLARFGLGGLEHRFPGELSGGQRQRVALAQALARAPDLLLLDEPFSSLDTPVRHELRSELRRLQRETGLSTVLVTHDPQEAAALADEVVVLTDGRVLQSGATAALFARPASPDVARLIGMRNIRRGRVRGVDAVEASTLMLAVETGDLAPGTELWWCVPAEQVVIGPAGRYPAVVVDRADLGVTSEVVVALAPGLELEAVTPSGPGPEVGAACRVDLPPGSIRLWPDALGADPRPVAESR